MVVNVIKWRPWLPTQAKRYEVAISVRCLKGLAEIGGNQSGSPPSDGGLSRLTVEIRWKGSKGNGFRALSRKVKRNCTKEEGFAQNGVVHWDEEFTGSCSLSGSPYEVAFFVFNGSDGRSKNKVMVAGPATLNLAEFASTDDKQEMEISVPLTHSSGVVECNPSLCLTLHLMELKTNQEPAKSVQRSLTMPLTAPLSPCFGVAPDVEKEEHSPPRKSLKKMKSLTEFMSSRRKSEKECVLEANSDGKFSTGSDDSEYNDSFDTDSFDYSDELSEENKEDSDNVPRNSFGYGSLVSANLAGGGFHVKRNCEDDDLVYYSNNKPDVDLSYPDDLPNSPEVVGQSLKLSPKLGILNWKKRKLSFRSPKVKVKGEPLLKKEYGERGGDDIDFDRYQLSSSDELSSRRCKTEEELLSISEFGDDSFAVGSWEFKEVVSRDGSMKLQTQVFFASIDQRNEKAAGESACTTLVAVITDWLHSNRGEMPIKSDLDSLIREGSLQWRNLCEVESYMARFPDKHFDLETVLEAEIKPISMVAEKSFIGFFHPEGVEGEEGLGFLDGAMSFDNIWDEISLMKDAESLIYIVSWNDHFFVLKVDADAYYVIDTLGERLYEGCNQAFVLKFDKDSTIQRVPSQTNKEDDGEKSASESVKSAKPELRVDNEGLVNGKQGEEEEQQETLVCKGKEACKEYIKSFLAAIPIRELQEDIKKGRTGSAPLHHRLQIEFHHTESLPVGAEATS